MDEPGTSGEPNKVWYRFGMVIGIIAELVVLGYQYEWYKTEKAALQQAISLESVECFKDDLGENLQATNSSFSLNRRRRIMQVPLQETMIQELGIDILKILERLKKDTSNLKCPTAGAPKKLAPAQQGSGSPSPSSFAVCGAVHNNHHYLREWLAFHLGVMGATRVVLLDFHSNAKAFEAAKKIASDQMWEGRVELFSGEAEAVAARRMEDELFQKCTEVLGQHEEADPVSWALFLHTGQYLFPLDLPAVTGGDPATLGQAAPTLTHALDRVMGQGQGQGQGKPPQCVQALSLEYGSSFLSHSPSKDQTTLANYLLREGGGEAETGVVGVHLNPDKESGKPTLSTFPECTVEESPLAFRVHTYLRSLEDFNELLKLSFASTKNLKVYSSGFYQFLERDANEFYDPAALQYVCKLKALL